MLSYRNRPRRSRAPLFFFLLALVFVSVNYLLADKAHAAHPEMTVEFSELELTKRGPELVLDYRVELRDWRQMKRAGIEPMLNLYLRDGRRGDFSFAYSLPLKRRAGSVVYPRALKLRGTRVVEFAVIGYSGFDRITQTRFGDSCGERVRLRVERHRGHASRPGHGHDHGYDDDHDDYDDHDEHVHHRDHDDRGTVHGRPGRTRNVTTASIIEACKEASSHIDVSACLQRARALPRHADPVATVAACGKTSSFNSHILQCIDKAKSVRIETADVVAACDAATNFASEFNQCIDRAAKYRHRSVVSVIKTCDDVTSFTSEFNSCMSRGENLGA